MAEETVLTPDEQATIYHDQTYKICRQMVIDWTATLGDQTPVALCAAIDAFAQGLIAHIGYEGALEFLDVLTSGLRKRGEEPKTN